MYQLQGISAKLLLCCLIRLGCIHEAAGLEKSGRTTGGFWGAKNGSLSWLDSEESGRYRSTIDLQLSFF